jgi:hypothetical protein
MTPMDPDSRGFAETWEMTVTVRQAGRVTGLSDGDMRKSHSGGERKTHGASFMERVQRCFLQHTRDVVETFFRRGSVRRG